MEVSFEIIQQEEEIDGEDVITHFCRYERFIDWVPILSEFGKKILLWDQTWKFEFDRLEDGDYVTFAEVKGMEALNESEARQRTKRRRGKMRTNNKTRTGTGRRS